MKGNLGGNCNCNVKFCSQVPAVRSGGAERGGKRCIGLLNDLSTPSMTLLSVE